MKIKSIALSLILLNVVGVIYSFRINEENLCMSEPVNWGDETSFVQLVRNDIRPGEVKSLDEVKFYIRSSRDRTISIMEMSDSKTVQDLYYHPHFAEIMSYRSVWLKKEMPDDYISLMSSNNEFTSEQKELMSSAKVGDLYEVIVNYESVNPITREVEQKRIYNGLKVVPDKEAEYPGGVNAMLDYFNEKTPSIMESVDIDLFQSPSFNFIIDERGEAIEIESRRETNNPEIEAKVQSLIEEMPKWIPGEMKNGEKVHQQFELTFGTVNWGC